MFAFVTQEGTFVPPVRTMVSAREERESRERHMVAMEMVAPQKHRVDRESPRLTLVPPVPHAATATRSQRSATPLVLVIAVIATLCLVVSAATAAMQTARAQALLQAASWERHVVQSGETVWGLASQSGCDADLQMVVSEILERNGLEHASVSAGQVLLIPNVG